MMAGSEAKRRCQNRALITTTKSCRVDHLRRKTRPKIGVIPRVVKNAGETRAFLNTLRIRNAGRLKFASE